MRCRRRSRLRPVRRCSAPVAGCLRTWFRSLVIHAWNSMPVSAKGREFSPMAQPLSLPRLPRKATIATVAALALLAAGAVLWAQVEGDRGIAPIASSGDIDVGGIEVDVRGDSPEDARQNGWREAQRKAWEKLGGPDIP